jgi:hypothetical protein
MEVQMSDLMDRLCMKYENFADHVQDWQLSRTKANEDAYDWNAFRDHMTAMGHEDPGEDEPDEFRQYDWRNIALHQGEDAQLQP